MFSSQKSTHTLRTFSVRPSTLVIVCVCVFVCVEARAYAVQPDGHLRWQRHRWYVGRFYPVHAHTHTHTHTHTNTHTHTFTRDTCTSAVHCVYPDSRIHTVMISSAAALQPHKHHKHVQDQILLLRSSSGASPFTPFVSVGVQTPFALIVPQRMQLLVCC